ncbi:metallophosphoesterase family protein [Rhodoferax sp.]|uniref:metallophosphoesterase family protein n=1 Tax=Rhodoferax sp. TaxID=50421 RepID=UPI00262D38C8|nr:metallophosphoesterase family protein [Rhodoferax sp.]MDD2924680.1 metallophosphoesterase family protein [Rhodoferax sp.]
MKLALLSDIHANFQALEACLEHAESAGARQFAFLGDLVGYGADPVAVIDKVRDLVAQGALVVKGNHDAMAVTPPVDAKHLGNSTAQWTCAQLDAQQKDFLDKLPLTLQYQAVLLVHASLDGPALWRYVSDQRAATASMDAGAAWPDVRYIFGGHVHLQTLYYGGMGASLMKFEPTPGIAVPVPRHRRWLATIGSVGQPRDGNPQAMYAMFDTDKLQLTFHRVDYDYQAAATAIRRAGLPVFFADRLERGQ